MRPKHFLSVFLTLLTLAVGQMWGADPTKTEGFEAATASTTYNSTATVAANQSDCSIGWTIYYGNVSTTSKITGNKSCLMRYYTASSSNKGYAATTTAIKGLKNVTFNAKVTDTGNKMGVWYSTDGSNWTAIATEVALTTSSASKSYDIPSSSASTNYYIKIGITSATTNKKDLIIDDVVFTYAGSGPSLSSVAVSGTPDVDIYEEGDVFDVTGLTVTGTYSDASPSAISEGITWKARTNELSDDAVALANYTLTKGQTSMQVQATVSEIASAWYTVDGLTVNEHVVTPGKYNLTLANAFWGTSGTGASAGHTASGKQNDISVSIAGSSGTQNYINNSETRIYGSHTITFSVPSGYVLKEITGLGTSSNSSIAVATGSTGTITTRVWSGSAQSVTFDVNGRTDFSTVSVTYAADVKYAVSFSAPIGGTLSIKDGDDAISSGDTFSEDKELTVTATPTAATHHGGTVKVVKTGVTPEADVTSTVYNAGTGKLTMPDYAITVSATFVADAAISVAVAAGQTGWGTVKLYNSDPEEVSSGTTFKPSAEFIIEATPESGYVFDHWTKSDGSDITLSEEDAADANPSLAAGEVSTTFTASFRAASTPNLAVDPASLSFDPIAVNGSQEKKFELMGENLTEDASLAITGTGAAMFSVASPVAKDGDGNILEDVTVTYNPTAAGTHTATLTISSAGAASREVALSGEAKNNYTIIWSVNGTPLTGAALDGVTTSVLDGGSVTDLPANPAGLTCKNTFKGWSKKNGGTTAQARSYYDDMFTDAEGAPTIDEPTTFYAVFGSASAPSTNLFSWEGGTASELTALDNVSANSLGSDYAAGNAPYRVKLDGTGDYIDITVTAAIASVAVDVKMLGGASSSSITVKESADGENFTDVQTLSISGAQNDVLNLSTTASFASTSRTVRLYFTKGSNVGVGPISITGVPAPDYVTECAAVEAPTFSPAAGEYSAAQDVTIASATDGAKIYYTLTTDGSTPANPTASSMEATSAITVNQNSKIKAIAIKGEDKSDIVSAEYTFKVATPEIIGSTAFVSTATVTITATGADAIYYTDDDSDPASSGTRKTYSAPFTVESTTTIKAIATKTNWTNSAVAEQAFTKITTISVADAIALIPNKDDVADNKYVSGVVCTAGTSVNASGQMTYYISDDGSETNRLQIYLGKNMNNTAFSAASDLAVGDRVVVFGQLKNFKGTKEMNSGNYLVSKQGPAVATPVFTPDGGGFMGETDVTITCATESNTIYYTTDGTTPSKLSTEYTAAIHLDATTTITAVAYVGEEHSLVVTKTFTLTDPMTVAEALTALDSEDPINNVAVAGIISTAPSSNPSSGKLTYYISDDGTTTSQLEVYNGFGLNGASFSAKTDLQVGDQVTVFGNLKIYNTTKEFDAGSRLLAFTRPTVNVTGVTLPATAIVRIGSPITLTPTIAPSNATNKNVSWSVISGNTYAEVSDAGVVTGLIAGGDAVIQVETEDGNFTATCTVSVAAARPTFTEDDHEWIKITNASKLVAGKFYVIAESANGKTATTSISSSVMGNVASTFDDGRIASGELGTNTAIFELGGNSTDGWTLYEVTDEENTGYFSGANASSFGWSKNVATTPISFNEDGKAILGDANGYRLLYNTNNGNPRFKTYSSSLSNSMLLPQLYMWAELSHAVTFDANGGVAESVPGVERTDEGKITIPETEPTHSDVAKVFAGWYKSDAPGTLYNAGDEFATNVDVTLYAKWNTVPTYTVTYVPGGSGTVPAVASYPAGKKVQVVTDVELSNPGYSFTGWTVKDADQNVLPVDEDNKFTMPAKNVTIVAGWARISNQKWNLVKHGDDLEIDAEYVIAYNSEDKKKALGAITTTGTHIGTAIDVNISGDILKGSDAMKVLTLQTGNGGLNYAFKNGDNYLTWSSGNSLDESATLNDAASWTIEIDENNEVDIKNVGTTTRYLQYNTGSPRFACYTGSQQKLRLYKKAASVVINDGQTVDAASITAGSDVTVENGGVLTVNEDKSIGDLTVENGGKVVLSSNKLTVVGVFSIESTMAGGSSGQLTGATNTNFAASGEAYIDITLGAGATADQWHAFTVPFPVDAINGVFDLDGNKLNNEEHYAIMEYDGSVRAQGKYGWKKIRTTLVPGTFYLMTVDGLRTTFRFKKKASEAIVAANSKQIYEYAKASEEVEDKHAGWNGIGNPNLFYGKIDVEVQVLDPNNYVYVKKDPNSTNFVVGTPFFYQASADGWISMLTADAGSKYAPRREEAKSIEKIKVSFGNEEYTDYLDIWASEEALNKYQIGKDLVKMTMTNAPKVAQIFGNAYNSKLCMVYAPMSNDKAEYALSLYAPANGEYTIAAQQIEDAEVYLTKDGSVIWNISEGAYTAEFTKGSTESYGLLMIKKTPQVTTGVDGVESSKAAQKLIIDQNVFILRGEKMYDVTGKEVK